MITQKLTKKQIRKEKKCRKDELAKTASKNKIIDALIELQVPSSFTVLKTKSGLAKSYFNKLLTELLDEEKVVEISVEGKHSSYTVSKIVNSQVLKVLSCSFLHDELEKINASTDRAKSISEFNRCLGSLVAYVLKSYDWSEASEILNTVLPMIGNYINLSNLRLPKELSDNPKQEPNVESSDWNLWRKLDSREYVVSTRYGTMILVQKGTNKEIKKKERKSSLTACLVRVTAYVKTQVTVA